MFDTNTLVTSFEGTFTDLLDLSSIPTDLFKYNVNVLDFGAVFYNCVSLTSIPIALFSTCINVTTYYGGIGDFGAFENCAALTGNAPALWDLVPEPTGTHCFKNCNGLTNYAAIPNDWK